MSTLLLKALQPGRQYLVQVRAKDQNQVSDWSPVQSLTTQGDTIAPSAPNGLTFVPNGSSFNASWSAPTTDSDGEALKDLNHYIITFTANGVSSPVVTKDTQFVLDFETNKALFGTPQASVDAFVKAVDNTGNISDASVVVSATNPPPASLASIDVQAQNEAINVSWSPSTDTDITNYVVSVSTTGVSGAYTIVYTGKNTQYIHSTALYNQDHYFKVHAVDVFASAGPDITSSAVRPNSSFTFDVTPPDAPTNVAASIVNNLNGLGAAGTVSWDQSTTTDLAGFNIRWRAVGETIYQQTTVDKDSRDTVVSLPDSYTDYEFQVRAFDWAANYSAWTATVTATSPLNDPPATVTGVTMDAGTDSVQISWNASTDEDVANGLGLYEVTFSTSSTFASGNYTYRTGSTTLTISGLSPSTQYYARVKAEDSGGVQSTSWSTTATATTSAFPVQPTSDGNPPASSPTPNVYGGIGYLFAQWTAVDNNDPVTYEVHLSTTTGFTVSPATKVLETGATVANILRDSAGNALDYSTTYYVRIVAKDVDGAAPAGTQAPGTMDDAIDTTAQATLDAAEYYSNTTHAGWAVTSLSDRVVIVGSQDYFYGVEESGTNIYINNSLVLSDANTGDVGTMTLNAGDIISVNKPVSFISVNSEHPLPLTMAGRNFAYPALRSWPDTVYIYAVGADANVTITDTTNDVTWTINVPANTVGSVVLTGQSNSFDYMTVVSDSDILVSKRSLGSNDAVSLLPMSREAFIWGYSVRFNADGNFTGVNITATSGNSHGVYLYGDPGVLVSATRYADGGGSDMEFALPWDASSDRYSIPHAITGYIVGSIEPCTVQSSYWDGTTWVNYATADLTAASKTNPVIVQEGDLAGNGVELIDSNQKLWRFVADGRFYLRTNTPVQKEYTVLGYRSDIRALATSQGIVGAAQDTATRALASADGKNTIYYRNTAPGATPNNAGDIWFEFDVSNNIIGQWIGIGGTSWTATEITSTVIANLDAGKITTGTITAETITLGTGGMLKSSNDAVQITDTGIIVTSDAVGGIVADAISGGTITATTSLTVDGFMTLANSGYIKSANYDSVNKTGFQLSATGLDIGDGVIRADSITSGTISSTNISLGIGGVISVDGSTGQIKSSTYSPGSTGWSLGPSGLEVNTGTITAGALVTGTISGTNTITLSGANAKIVAGTWSLSGSGLSIPTGGVSAAAVNVQVGQNIMPYSLATMELPLTSTPVSLTSTTDPSLTSVSLSMDTISYHYRPQSLNVSQTAAQAHTVVFGPDINTNTILIPELASTYIVSMWVRPSVTNALTMQVYNGNTSVTSVVAKRVTDNATTLVANTWQRIYMVTTSMSVVGAAVRLVLPAVIGTWNIDGVQFEKKMAGNTSTKPSDWTPPSTTTIDGGQIKTGTIASTQTKTINGVSLPLWSVDMDGSAQFGDLIVRGNTLVGADSAEGTDSYIQSFIFSDGDSPTGWKINSDGTAIFNNATVKGDVEIDGVLSGSGDMSAQLNLSGSLVANGSFGESVVLGSQGFYVYPADSIGITNVSLTSNVATFTTDGPHGIDPTTGVGMPVKIDNVGSPFNDMSGNAVVNSVPSATTFTIAIVNADVASTTANGVAYYNSGAAGSPNIAFPTDGSPNIITGSLRSDAVVSGSLEVTNNVYFDQGSVSYINDGVRAPTAAPVLSNGYEMYSVWSGAYGDNDYPSGGCVDSNGDMYMVTQRTAYRTAKTFTNLNITLHKRTGGPTTGPWSEINTTIYDIITMFGDSSGITINEIEFYNGFYYLLLNNTGVGKYAVAILDSTYTYKSFVSIPSYSAGGSDVTMGFDFTNSRLMFVSSLFVDLGHIDVGIAYGSAFNATTGSFTMGSYSQVPMAASTYSINSPPQKIMRGGFGGTAVSGFNLSTGIVARTDYRWNFSDTSGNEQATWFRWREQSSWAAQYAAFFNPVDNHFYDISTIENANLKLVRYQNVGITWNPNVVHGKPKLYVRSTFYQYSASTHYETLLSPAASINPNNRGVVTVRPQSIPGFTNGAATPGPLDADSARIWLYATPTPNGADASPKSTSYDVYGNVLYTNKTGVNTFDENYTGAGLTPPQTEGWAGVSNPAMIMSSSGNSFWKGDDSAQFQSLVVVSSTDASTNAGNKPALRIGNIAGQHLRVDGNEILAMNDDTTQGTLNLNLGGIVYVSGKFTAKNYMQAGSVTATIPNANTTYQISVTFPTPWDSSQVSGTPVIALLPDSAVPQNVFVGIDSVSYTGFVFNIRRSDSGTNTAVHWIAACRS